MYSYFSVFLHCTFWVPKLRFREDSTKKKKKNLNDFIRKCGCVCVRVCVFCLA